MPVPVRRAHAVLDSAATSGSRVQDELDVFLDSLYSSLDLERLLENYLGTVSRLIPAPSYALYLFDMGTGRPSRVAARGVGDRFLELYENEGRRCDPLLRHLSRSREPVHEGVLYPEDEWDLHPMRHVLSLHRLERVLEAPLIVHGQVAGTLNFARTGGEPRFGDDDLSMAERISRHTSLAIGHALAIGELRERSNLAEAVVQVAGSAILLTDLDGRLKFANHSAQDLLLRGETNEALGRCLRSTLKANLDEIAKRAHEATRHLYMPVRRPGRDGYLTLRSVRLPAESDAVATFLYQPGQLPDFLHLTSILSTREVQVLELVAQGLENKQIANELTISLNTVKSHLKRMSAKMEVTSRAQLVGKALCTALSAEPEQAATPETPGPDRDTGARP